MNLQEVKWELRDWTPHDELEEKVYEAIRRAMPENVSWWRISLATRDAVKLFDRDDL